MASLNASLKGKTPGERKQILTAGAQKEGGFMLYSTMNAGDAQALIDAFNKAYPFAKAQVFRTTDGDLANKALTEVRAKKTLFDVIDVSPESVLSYENAGAVTPFDSPSLDGLPPNMRDPAGNWAYMYLNGVVPAWNTQKVKPDEAPKSYDDFLSPRWKDKLSIDEQDYAWGEFVKATMGEAKGTAFLQKLAAQNPHVLNGRTNQLNLLTAGEFDISVALFDYSVIAAKKKGAPIDYVYLRPTMIAGEALMADKTAPHPYTGMLFIDWLFSKDGMQVLADATGRMVPRNDVTLKNPEIAEQTKGEVWVQTPDSGKDLAQKQKAFNDLFKAAK
jgi:iron(III) transport system substrate-binding protein